MLRIEFINSGRVKGYVQIDSCYGECYCGGYYSPRRNAIGIVRQRSVLDKAYILLHELGHWLMWKAGIRGYAHYWHDEFDRKFRELVGHALR